MDSSTGQQLSSTNHADKEYPSIMRHPSPRNYSQKPSFEPFSTKVEHIRGMRWPYIREDLY